ncbi:MAG TPA: hypothetical protein VMM36_10330 [Opitutaceae bacterium]|nr:hypothetical protein [Opitutaceae bacterium]
MKTFTSFVMVMGPVAAVVLPGFAAAGVTFPIGIMIAIPVIILAVVAYAHKAPIAIERHSETSSTAKNFFEASPAPVASRVPFTSAPAFAKAAPVGRITGVKSPTRRVRAIVEIAA